MNQAAAPGTDVEYHAAIRRVAETCASWSGPVVVVGHDDPDGDALGSTLALARALRDLGKDVTLPMEVPAYLRFLVEDGEVTEALETLPEGTLLVVLDVAEPDRTWGAPLTGAALTLDVDHHAGNPRFGDVSLVAPERAATAEIVKDVLDALPVAWTPRLATPCLTGILTDTGSFRYANTSPQVLRTAADLIGHGVDYEALADRLQWRPPGYFRMLGEVMATVSFPLGGRVVMAHVDEAMRERSADPQSEGDDFVSVIRYAEGAALAVLLKQRDDAVKISVRSRAPVSARRVCEELGGGGHDAAAGAKLRPATLQQAQQRVLQAAERELARHGADPAPGGA